MKAWEYEYNLRTTASPKLVTENHWNEAAEIEVFPKSIVLMFWKSEVPGSQAPECLMAGAIQSVENIGRDVSKAEELFEMGLKLLEDGKTDQLKRITSQIFAELNRAPIVENHPYHKFRRPSSWSEISVSFPKRTKNAVDNLDERVLNAWIGQIAGASMGTHIEGYLHDSIEKVFKTKLGSYLGPVSTFNDDITYELAFLKAVEENGANITAADIGFRWVEMIPFGCSAEYIALDNLKRGILPPESGSFGNPFQEWIGAQMRCMVQGLVCPGDPHRAAHMAYLDAQISHSGNGIYGGIHSAVMTSLAFVEADTRQILGESTRFIPSDTEFSSVLNEVLEWCKKASDWKDVMRRTYERFKMYNWIHVYPNLAAVVTSLWFGEGDFDRTMYIVSSFGYDVDCNAGEVGTILGAMGSDIASHWTDPLANTLRTYVRNLEKITITELAQWTIRAKKKIEEGC